ncbi:MAG: ANTAR domain-containing protein, partial [Lachnospiraceae bacterium]|nr:ANTAR domain-containing protein [Lachnospiraceae bacterium]
MEELKTVSRAKILLMEKKHMTEEEAHRYIGKQAMNNGVSRGNMALEIIEDLQ